MLLISDSIKINASPDHVFRMTTDGEALGFLLGQYGSNMQVCHNEDEPVSEGKVYQLYKNNKPLSHVEIHVCNPACLLEMNIRLLAKKPGIPEQLRCKTIYARYDEACLFQYAVYGDMSGGGGARLAIRAMSQRLKYPRNELLKAWVNYIEQSPR